VLWPQSRNHNTRIGRWLLAFALACTSYGQTPASQPLTPAAPASGGQGEVAFQGYYLGGSQQEVTNTTGTVFRFQEFLPGFGYLSGSLEGYAGENRFQTGENFLELRGLPWLDHYWTFTGGDFQMPATLVEFPFNNIFIPRIDARGVKVQATHGDTQYSFFVGQEMLLAGARVVYRIPSPQRLMGVSVVRKVAPHLLVGARLMEFSANAQAVADNPSLFSAGLTGAVTRTLALQSSYTPFKRLKIYVEGSRPATGARRSLTSVLAGFSWETDALTVRANYSYLGSFYFPMAGYFAGDRQGPFGEVRLRPWTGLELFASASKYRNNLEHDSAVPLLNSTSSSAGISALLPGKLSLIGQISMLRYTDQEPGESAVVSDNRQISAGLSRGFGHQTFQVNWRDILLGIQPTAQRQRSSEVGDTYQFKHFALGGSVRYQQITGSERLNSLFFRGLAQVNAGPVSAYANVEVGNDLANQTVFSTEAYRTSVVGASVRLPRGWSLQAEMFRNQLNVALNQENIFLLQNDGALAGLSPAAAALSATSQWSVFFRLSKQLRWGSGLPQENAASHVTVRAASLTGSIEGMVRLKMVTGSLDGPAASIPLSLDGVRTVLSGPDGHYVFDNVPEGSHEVGLALAELPADFDPGARQKTQVAVQPRRPARADFDVLPLAVIPGHVTGPEGVELHDIVIRLLPGNRYTTTRNDGSFTFYNVREGDFEVALDATTLPPAVELKSPSSFGSSVRIGTPPAPVEFVLTGNTSQKPIRKVLDRK